MPERVLITLDVDDPVCDESDLALEALLHFLLEERIPAVLFITGEKTAKIADRKPHLIDLMASFEIGYHSDTHSRHPTYQEAVTGLNFQAGTKRFLETETPGLELVRATFSTNVQCYRAPGFAWMSEQVFGTKLWGMDCDASLLSYHSAGRPRLLDTLSCRILGQRELPSPVFYMDEALKKGIPPLFKRMAAFRPLSGDALVIGGHPWALCHSVAWDRPFFKGRNPAGNPFCRIEKPGEMERRLEIWYSLLRTIRRDYQIVSLQDLLSRMTEKEASSKTIVRSTSEDILDHIHRGAYSLAQIWYVLLTGHHHQPPPEVIGPLLETEWPDSGTGRTLFSDDTTKVIEVAEGICVLILNALSFSHGIERLKPVQGIMSDRFAWLYKAKTGGTISSKDIRRILLSRSFLPHRQWPVLKSEIWKRQKPGAVLRTGWTYHL